MLERTGAQRLGIAQPTSGPPDAAEQSGTQGGHLLLSALAA